MVASIYRLRHTGLMAEMIDIGLGSHTYGNWRHRAACLAEDPELFFPENKHRDHPDVVHAVDICVGCKVRRECLDRALENKESSGIWGGFTKQELKIIQNKIAKGALSVQGALNIEPEHPKTVELVRNSQALTRQRSGHRLEVAKLLEEPDPSGRVEGEQLNMLIDYGKGASLNEIKKKYGYLSTKVFYKDFSAFCELIGLPYPT